MTQQPTHVQARTHDPNPHQPAYNAVYAYIRGLGSYLPPDRVHRNALIWRAVHNALNATPAGRCISSHCVESDHILPDGEEADANQARLLSCGFCREENGEETHPHPECPIGTTASALRELLTAAMSAHELDTDRAQADADGNAPCVCGNWREPGPMGSDEDSWDAHMADVALAVILPTTQLLDEQHRPAHNDLQRVTALYEQWVKAGPPPLGTPMARWWDKRLAELHAVLLPCAEQQKGCRCHNGDELCSGCRRCPLVCNGCDGPPAPPVPEGLA
jgi:hypothetical protein